MHHILNGGEERVVGDYLDSAAGFFREMIFVDTGSVDRTREIALSKGATLVDFSWVDSFSAARNESMRHAAGKWIFWMDCDDTLPLKTVEMIQEAAIHAAPDIMGFVIPVQFTDQGRQGGTRVDHLKLFRNVPGLEWEGHIHEQILALVRQLGGEIARLDCVVLHSGYDTSPKGQEKKRRRDFKLLELDMAARPDHPFVHFNMGMTLHYLKDWEAALPHLGSSITLAPPQASHLRKAFALLAGSLLQLGRIPEAARALDDGLAMVGEDPELRLMRAELRAQMNDPDGALADALAIRELSGAFQSLDMGAIWRRRAELMRTLLR